MKKLLIMMLALAAFCFSARAQTNTTISDSGCLFLGSTNTSYYFNNGKPDIHQQGNTVFITDGKQTATLVFGSGNTYSPPMASAAALASYCQVIANRHDTVAILLNKGLPIIPIASSGLLINKDSIGSTKDSVKGSPGQLYGYSIYNPNSYAVYIQFFNAKASNVTVGTTADYDYKAVAASASKDVGPFPIGIPYSTGITVAITKTAHGSAAPALNCYLVLYYY